MRRLLPLLLAALLVPSPAGADVRLPGPLLALTAGPGSAYAVVSTRSRNAPFRLVRSGGRSARSLSTFGSPGAEFADVAAGPGGSVAVFGRPTSDGFSYELAGGQELGEGTGPPVLALDGATPFAAFPDNDGDAVLGRGPDDITTLTTTGPALRHAPLDVTGGPLVLDLVQSGTRTELRVLGPGAPAAAITSMPGLRAIPATIARDAGAIYVAYRVRNRLTLAMARPGGRWSHRRLRVKGVLSGAPAVARVGLRTFVATSQRTKRRRSIFLTTSGPAGTFTDRLTKPRGSDLQPLAATGPDGHLYVGWTRRRDGSSRRFGLLRRVL